MLGPGNYSLAVGLYNWKTAERLPVFDVSTRRQDQDQIVIPNLALRTDASLKVASVIVEYNHDNPFARARNVC